MKLVWVALLLALHSPSVVAAPLIILAAQALAAQALATYGAISAAVALTVQFAAVIYGSVEARRKQRRAQAQARAAYNASLQDRNTTVLRADPPWRTLYGRAITGGDIVAIFTSDKAGTRTDGSAYTKADAYKHLVIAIAAHQCETIHEVYVDGVPLGALDGNGNVTGGEFSSALTETREITIAASGTSTQPAAVTVLNAWDETLSTFPAGGDAGTMVAGSYTLTVGNTVITNTGANPLRIAFTIPVTLSGVRVQKRLGTASQAADSFLTGVVPAEWTAADRLRGITYAVVTLDLENQRFQGGPPNITFDVAGRLVFDPRNSTTAWSANPALCIRDYLLGEHGFNCVAGDVDDAYSIIAANACDANISLDVGGTVTSGATYTCNGVITTDQSREAVLQDLAECMAGTVTYGAQWLIQAGVWTAPVMALTDDDLHGQAEVVQGGAGMDDTFNTVRGQYVPAGSGVPADFDVYANAAFVAADGRSLYTDVALPFTDHKARCRNLARIFTERNRDGLIVRYPAKLRAWPLQIGDRVTLTSAEYGWAAKTFRVTDWQFGLTTAVQLVLQEDAPAIYDLADAASSDPAANTLLPNPWVVNAPASVTVSSGTSVAALADGGVATRVRVSWAAITDPYLADGSGRVLVRWRRQYRDAVNVWRALPPVPASEIYAFIVGANAGDAITVEVRFQNGVGALSPATYVTHTVTGNATTVRTAQIAANAATEVFTINDNSAQTLTNTLGADLVGQSIASQLIGPYDVDVRVVASGITRFICSSDGTARNDGRLNIDWRPFTDPGGAGASLYKTPQQRFQVCAVGGTDETATGTVIGEYALAAGVDTTVHLVASKTDNVASYGAGTANDTTLRIEVIKR